MSNVRALPPDLQKVAIDELNEVPERVPADIEALRTWIKQQPHLRARTDDQFLLAFLRGCKFSLEKAKSKIDKYYMLRSKFPEVFACSDIDEPKIREIIRLGLALYLPLPLHGNGPRIAIVRYGSYSPDKYTFGDIMLLGSAFNELIMLEDDCAMVSGLVHILDMSQATLQHFLQIKPSLMKKINVYSEESLPLRPKAIHYINTPAGFEPLYNTFKPMMPKKQQERMHVHGSKLENLYAHVPQKYLPKEYGGENGSLDELTAYWEEKLLSYRDYFKDEVNYGTDEHLRLGKPIDFDNIFGMEGSFRKLDVD